MVLENPNGDDDKKAGLTAALPWNSFHSFGVQLVVV